MILCLVFSSTDLNLEELHEKYEHDAPWGQWVQAFGLRYSMVSLGESKNRNKVTLTLKIN